MKTFELQFEYHYTVISDAIERALGLKHINLLGMQQVESAVTQLAEFLGCSMLRIEGQEGGPATKFDVSYEYDDESERHRGLEEVKKLQAFLANEKT